MVSLESSNLEASADFTVTVRNVCQLVNVIAPCSVQTFKKRALEYICLNLEAVLQNGYVG